MPESEENKVSIFSGTFDNEETARMLAFEHTIEEPDDDADDDAWDEYDEAYLTVLEQEVKAHIEPEFVEVIFGDDRLDYLKEKLASESDFDAVSEKAKSGNCLILVYSGNGVNEEFEVASNPSTVSFLGAFSYSDD